MGASDTTFEGKIGKLKLVQPPLCITIFRREGEGDDGERGDISAMTSGGSRIGRWTCGCGWRVASRCELSSRRANFFIRIGKVACQMRRRLAKRLPLARAFYRVGRTGFYVVLLSAPYCFCYNL